MEDSNFPVDYKHYDTGIDDPLSDDEESSEADSPEHQERSDDNASDLDN